MTLSQQAKNRLKVGMGSKRMANEIIAGLNPAGAAGAALTAQLTTITPADAAGTPDYAIAAITQTTPFGFSVAAEAITLLYVVRNLQVRVAELEARLQAAGIIS